MLSFNIYSQQRKFCSDSSIRTKYSLNYPTALLFNNPDTAGQNIFVGGFTQVGIPTSGIFFLKTDWDNNISVAKKIYLSNTSTGLFNSFDGPNGSVICTGSWGNSNDLLLCRIDTNGNILWAKRYRLTQFHLGYSLSNQLHIKNIIVTNDAIHFNAGFSKGLPLNEKFNSVVKLDLNGNIIWSKSFKKNISSLLDDNVISDAPLFFNGEILVLSNMDEFNSSGQVQKKFSVITKLNDADGSLMQSIALKTIPDNTINVMIPEYFRLNKNNTLSVTGTMGILTSNGPNSQSHFPFHLTLNNNLSILNSFYYRSNPIIKSGINFDFNNLGQKTFLADDAVNNNKYFVTFDTNNVILRSRKFLLPPTGTYRSSINFDDKQNIHFTYNYRQNNKAIVEYARISDLTAANTVSCFGIDTSILQPVPFTLSQEPFVWDVEYTNLVTSFPVNLIEESETITKEVICKQVSYCDSVKIKGNAAICLSGNTARYSVYQNPECLKSINWQTDTTLATIISNEADTAVTLRFKKTGQFYLKAAVNNCVVADSMLITVTTPQTHLQLNKDSLLCPGSSLLLSVNPFFKTYQWQDGSTQNSFTVTSPGLYHITATDSCGNVIKDSIRVSLVDTSFNIPNAYTFCEYDTARVLLPANIININWQPSVSGILNGNKLLLYPQQPTIYNITAQRPPGCAMQKTITVAKENCPEWVRFPSAFTPNGDGLNDNYQPIVSGQIANFSLKIFNRTGQLIFSSNNPSIAWSGRYKGIIQPTGLYVFFCNYRFINGTEKTTKGTIMLLR